jgi:hypothetical protein
MLITLFTISFIVFYSYFNILRSLLSNCLSHIALVISMCSSNDKPRANTPNNKSMNFSKNE